MDVNNAQNTLTETVDKDNCTKGAKQPIYWLQLEGSNVYGPSFPPENPPTYRSFMGFNDGPQNDIFENLADPVTGPASYPPPSGVTLDPWLVPSITACPRNPNGGGKIDLENPTRLPSTSTTSTKSGTSTTPTTSTTSTTPATPATTTCSEPHKRSSAPSHHKHHHYHHHHHPHGRRGAEHR
jgi:hypothetical protein